MDQAENEFNGRYVINREETNRIVRRKNISANQEILIRIKSTRTITQGYPKREKEHWTLSPRIASWTSQRQKGALKRNLR